MENASKALIMAASVILGIMIITFSVFIFGIFKDYNAKNTSQIEERLGKDGKIVTNLTTGEVTVFESVTEEVTIGTGPKAEYAGMLTGYGPDCVGCTGLLYCPDSDGKYHYLTNDIESTYFYDKEYGKVRILASDPTLFPCGTIIHIVNNDLDIYGVCLDTGIAMRNAWRNYGSVLIDLAFTSESVTNVVTNRNTNFTVLRWGW